VVLPFINLSADPQQEFSDALTEEMISQLGSLQPEHLGVIARTTAMQYKNTKKTAREIGSELAVDYILETSVQRSGDRVRITAQLISARDETHLWSESYDRELSDILLLRRDVAQAVTNAIQIKLTSPQRAFLGSKRSLNPQAYDLYLMGMYYTESEWSPRAYEKGRQFFEKAIDADRGYAAPYAALANIYVELCLFGVVPHQEALAKGKAAALRSLELDDQLPEAPAAMANVKFMLEWDWWGAERDYRRATQLHLARLTGARRYVRFLMLTGRADEGMAFHQRVMELDPLSTEYRILLGWDLLIAHRYDEGIRHLQRMIQDDANLPPLAHYLLSWNYALAGRCAEAIVECERIHNPQACAYAYAAWGHREKALALARENEKDDPVFTSEELDEIVPYLAAALASVGANEDVTFAVTGSHGLLGKFSPKTVTTGRVFVHDQRLNVIFGVVHDPFAILQMQSPNVPQPFTPGTRAKRIDANLAITPGNGRLATGDRPDWVTFDTARTE